MGGKMSLNVFWKVNAFTDTVSLGNPAGVFIVDEFPKDHIMQQIAKELDWSETAFFQTLSQTKEKLCGHLRWFSPKDEAPFCGHATLATAHLLFSKKFPDLNHIEFHTKSGPFYAKRLKNDFIALDLPLKPVTECPCPDALKDALHDENGNPVQIEKIYRDDALFIVVLQDAEILKNLKVNLDKILTLDCRAVSVTTKGLDGYDFQSRYFAPRVGILEDPVCGSSHARLGPLWGQIFNKKSLKAYQASARGGTLWVDLQSDRILLKGYSKISFEASFF